jgi:glycerol uptake facilitator-like aquaporin
MTPARRLTGELFGTAFLLAAVVGSGIMGERLSAGNVAMALLGNTLATGATLVTVIFTFGSVSGAHFNPAVTLAEASQGGIRWREVPGYITPQVTRALLGRLGGSPDVWRGGDPSFAACPPGQCADVQ